MRMEEAFYNISMYLYNKNILEYAQIVWNGTESMITFKYIDSHSSIIYALLTLNMADKKVSKKVKPI